MFEWIKNIRKGGTSGQAVEFLTVESQPVKEVQISEPVLSFVECVKNNPKRFKVKRLGQYLTYFCYGSVYELKDTATNMVWVFEYFFGEPAHITDSDIVLTEGEAEYITNNLYPVFADKVEKLSKLIKWRRERANNKERERLMSIYCTKGS